VYWLPRHLAQKQVVSYNISADNKLHALEILFGDLGEYNTIRTTRWDAAYQLVPASDQQLCA
jgi:hypothetical protein